MASAPYLVPFEFESRPLLAGPALAVASTTSGSAAATRKGPRQVTGHAAEERARVLVVDPDPHVRSILDTRLSAEGFEVTTVARAADAWKQLAPGKLLPSVVVAECHLIDADGVALCNQLRADIRTAHIPVLLVASRGKTSDFQKAGLSVADLFLPKPVYANDIVTIVRLWAGQPAQTRVIETLTADVPVGHALRALLAGARSGRISFQDGSAHLSFRDGRIVDAEFEGATGASALTRIVMLSEGAYAISFGPTLARSSCSVSLEELCHNLMPRMGRWQQLLGRSVPLDAVLEADFKRLVDELARLPEELNPVVRLCDGHRTVRDVIRESAIDEATTLEAINRLYMMEVLVPGHSTVSAPTHRPSHLRVFQPEPAEVAEERMAELFGESVPDASTVLAPELARQLNAFQIQPVVESREPSRVPAAVEGFARGEPSAEETAMDVAFDSLELAFFQEGDKPFPEETWVNRRTVAAFFGTFVLVMAVGLTAIGLWTAPVSTMPATLSSETAPTTLPSVKPSLVFDEPSPTLADGVRLYDEGKPADAAVILARVVDSQPTLPEAWFFLGLARFDSGDTVGAQDAAVRAAELESQGARAHMLLASIYMTQKERAKAEVELRRYLELEPKGAYADEAQRLLAKP